VSAPRIYKAINAVMAELAEAGIAKSHTNVSEQYQYRSIDDVLNRLAPLLVRHRLCVLPRVLERIAADRIGIRGEVLSLRSRDYVEAARVLGASNFRIIFQHILPNVIPLLIVSLSLTLPGLILTEAALSFLGFGVQIPTPSWGNMLENAREYFTRSWTNVFIPGFLIFLTVLSISLVGNGLRDALDPRLND
jgi:ABC-type antimicrobial peptide transport system permease subunit